MSLINQMLQDLDARRSEATASGELGQQVRAVPPAKKITPAIWGGAAAAFTGIAMLGAGWYWWQSAGATPDPMQAPAPVIYHATGKMPVPKGQPVPSHTAQAASSATPAQASMAQTALPQPVPVPGQENAGPKTEPRILPLRLDTDLSRIPPAPAGRNAIQSEAVGRPVQAAMPAMADARQEAPRVMPAIAKSVDPAAGKQPKELTALQRAENEYRKAAQALQQGKTAEALNGFEQAIFLDPLHAPARQAVISLLLERGQQDAAIRRAREGIAIDPAQVGTAMILARLQVEKGELKSAIEVLENSLRYAGDNADFHAFLAALLQRDERHKDAIEHYFAAVKQTPQSGVWWMGLGISLQAQQRNADAQEAYRRAKATNSLSGELLSFVDSRLAQLQK